MSGVEKLNLEPLFVSQLISNLEIKIAVNKDVIIPISNVVAKPLIGPVPKAVSYTHLTLPTKA